MGVRKNQPTSADHQEDAETDRLVEERADDHRQEQDLRREAELLDQLGVVGDGGGRAQQPLVDGGPRQEPAEQEDAEARRAHPVLLDLEAQHYRENEGEQHKEPEGLDERPEERQHRPDVAALEVPL